LRLWAASNINRELVAEGHAWVYRQYMTDRSLLEDEDSARSNQIGLWSLDNPIPPWDWRRGGENSHYNPHFPKNGHVW
jgi:endonuclease YncB( thermonuclease family)